MPKSVLVPCHVEPALHDATLSSAISTHLATKDPDRLPGRSLLIWIIQGVDIKLLASKWLCILCGRNIVSALFAPSSQADCMLCFWYCCLRLQAKTCFLNDAFSIDSRQYDRSAAFVQPCSMQNVGERASKHCES